MGNPLCTNYTCTYKIFMYAFCACTTCINTHTHSRKQSTVNNILELPPSSVGIAIVKGCTSYVCPIGGPTLHVGNHGFGDSRTCGESEHSY